jgi:competence protein ComEC
VVLTAAAAALGAFHPWDRALVVGAVVALLALRGPRVVLVPLAVALLTSGLAQRSLDGLDELEAGPVVGEVTLVSDPAPAPFGGGVRADVRLAGRRLEARAQGPAAHALADRLAGEVVHVRGQVAPVDSTEPWLQVRHVSGRVRVLAVDDVRPGHPVAQLANGLRRTLVAGTTSLDERERSLFTGLVLGDDRHQPSDLADSFRGAGLTHLLAVSGQNVAFALAMAGPVLRRLRLWPRLVATLAVIGLFGLMTRFEPSVLRASAMAGLAATLAMAGRPIPRLRIVALAVTALLLVDPLLVRAVGFQLSVCAATAIVVLAPRLAQALPGPAGLRDAVAVTTAAQLGVAPVLIATFGPLPLVSLPANLLAVPVAGWVMVWGLTAAMAAGALGEPIASLVHAPTRAALGWLELVATRAARAPLGAVGPAQALVLGGAVVAVALAPARAGVRRAAGCVALGTLALAVAAAQVAPPLRSAPMVGMVRWHAGGTDVVVLAAGERGAPVGSRPALAALREVGVRDLDLLVVADPQVAAETVEAIVASHPTAAVLAHRDVDADSLTVPIGRVAEGAEDLDVGRLRLRVVDLPDRLVVEAR